MSVIGQEWNKLARKISDHGFVNPKFPLDASAFERIRTPSNHVWGEVGWAYQTQLVFSATKPNNEPLSEPEMKALKVKMLAGAGLLVCGLCSAHFSKHISKLNTASTSLRTRAGLLAWLCHIQNEVNLSQGRRRVLTSQEQAISIQNRLLEGYVLPFAPVSGSAEFISSDGANDKGFMEVLVAETMKRGSDLSIAFPTFDEGVTSSVSTESIFAMERLMNKIEGMVDPTSRGWTDVSVAHLLYSTTVQSVSMEPRQSAALQGLFAMSGLVIPSPVVRKALMGKIPSQSIVGKYSAMAYLVAALQDVYALTPAHCEAIVRNGLLSPAIKKKAQAYTQAPLTFREAAVIHLGLGLGDAVSIADSSGNGFASPEWVNENRNLSRSSWMSFILIMLVVAVAVVGAFAVVRHVIWPRLKTQGTVQSKKTKKK